MAKLPQIDFPYPGPFGIDGIRSRSFAINTYLTRIDRGPLA